MTWPSGSRTKKPFLNPKLLSGIDTAPDETSCVVSRKAAAAASISDTINVVCQCQRSVGRESIG